MEIIWSPEAANDFRGIIQYIRKDNDSAALRVARSILHNIRRLEKLPRSGRPGRVDGTRELPLIPLPFVVVYRVKANVVEVARVLHGAQRWP